MPKSPIHNAIARQWELLKNLPTHGSGLTAGQLTRRVNDAGFAATKRTIERDLNDLAGQFGIMCDNEKEPYLWHWMKGRALDLPGMDFAEALSLALVEDLLGKLAPVALQEVLKTKFKQARKKLCDAKSSPYSDWADRVRYVSPALPSIPPKIETRVLATVQKALLENRQLEVRYCSHTALRPSDYILHPLAFIQYGVIAYLVATTADYTDPRLYALHRMQEVKMSPAKSKRPKDFSLDEYLEKGGLQFGDGEMIRLKAVVSTKLACYLAESPLTKDQKLTAVSKDQYTLSVTIKDSWQLQFWILSQGAEITVMQPKELRGNIRGELQATLDGYRLSQPIV